MNERTCLQLTQDGRCSICDNMPSAIETTRNGSEAIERTCSTCGSYRVDLKEPLAQQKNETGFILTQ